MLERLRSFWTYNRREKFLDSLAHTIMMGVSALIYTACTWAIPILVAWRAGVSWWWGPLFVHGVCSITLAAIWAHGRLEVPTRKF